MLGSTSGYTNTHPLAQPSDIITRSMARPDLKQVWMITCAESGLTLAP